MTEPLSLRDEAIRAAAKAMAGGTGAWGGLYAEDAAQAVDAVLGVLTTRGEAFVRAHPNASAGALLRHLALGVAPTRSRPKGHDHDALAEHDRTAHH